MSGQLLQVVVLCVALLPASIGYVTSDRMAVDKNFSSTKLYSTGDGSTNSYSDSKVLGPLVYNGSGNTNHSCPTWFRFDLESSECVCGALPHSFVECVNNATLNIQEARVLDCYCITQFSDSVPNQQVVGACPYNCGVEPKSLVDPVYHSLPRDPLELDDRMCGERYNRTGRLCGRCKDYFSPLVYSYQVECVNCTGGYENWVKFFAVATIPATFFYFFVIFFNINVTATHFQAFILFAQIITEPTHVRLVLVGTSHHPAVKRTVQALGAFYGIWNLDYFRIYSLNICLNISTLNALALDYIVAAYPLILIAVSYGMIELHGRNCKVIVVLWKPFNKLLTAFRSNWDVRTSVIDAFATFLLLCSVKVLFTSFKFLVPTRLYDINKTDLGLFLHYNAEYQYWTSDHLPYAIGAVAVLVLFILVPILLLILYPMRWFQKFLGCFPCRLYALHTFMDSFQGCYKDGTEPGTRDCRWFASVYLILRVMLFVVYALTLETMAYCFFALLFLSLAIVVVLLQPYKQALSHYSAIDAGAFIILATWCCVVEGINIANVKHHQYRSFLYGVAVLISVFPLIYLIATIVYWIYSRRRRGDRFMQTVQSHGNGEAQTLIQDSVHTSACEINRGSVQENALEDTITLSFESSP